MISKFVFLCLAPLVAFPSDTSLPHTFDGGHDAILYEMHNLLVPSKEVTSVEIGDFLNTHTETLKQSRQGVLMGLKASIRADSLYFLEFMRTENSKSKPDLNTVNETLLTAAFYNKPLYIRPLFSYRFGIPMPNNEGVHQSLICAAKEGNVEFMDELDRVLCAESAQKFDWIFRPNYKILIPIILKTLFTAHMYHGMSHEYDKWYRKDAYAIHDSMPTLQYRQHVILSFAGDFIKIAISLITMQIILKWVSGEDVYGLFNKQFLNKALSEARKSEKTQSVRWLLSKIHGENSDKKEK